MMKKPLKLKQFAARMEAATRKAGFAVAGRQGTTLTVILHDQPVRCNLKTAYQAYQNAPDRLDDIIAAHLSALGKAPPPPPPPTEAEAAESLLPMLQSPQWVAETQKANIPLPVQRPFVAGLIIAYVLDMPAYRVYLNEEVIPQFTGQGESSLDGIHEAALDNLRRRTSRRHYQMHGLGDKTLAVCETDDGFAAARILLPELMVKWAARIPGRMLIGVPNRDFMIAFSDRDPEQVAAMARQVRRDAKERDHMLCPDLLVWDGRKVKEFRPRH